MCILIYSIFNIGLKKCVPNVNYDRVYAEFFHS